MFLGQAAVWAAMLGFLHILVALRVGSTGAMLLLVIVMALLIVALNLLLARFVARLVASRGQVRPALASVWKADPRRDAPMLSTVLLRLVLTGALVPIWILGHTSTTVRVEHTQDGDETTTNTTSEHHDAQRHEARRGHPDGGEPDLHQPLAGRDRAGRGEQGQHPAAPRASGS